MKKLLLSVLCLTLGISLSIAQTKSVIKKKESAADYVSKNFKEKYVDAYFVDPYSYKPLKIWVSDSVTLNDSLSYYIVRLKSDTSFLSYINLKHMRGESKFTEYGMENLRKEYSEEINKSKSRIDYISSLPPNERSAIILYKVKLDCYAKSRNGNESLMRLDITCNVLPDKTYYVRWWKDEDVYEYNK